MRKYVSNPDLITVKKDWPGTPLDSKGRFRNHLNPNNLKFSDVLKWQSSKNPDKPAKLADTFKLEVNTSGDFLKSDKDCMVWLGHASFFMRIIGKTFLIDPVLKSPSISMKRLSQFPVAFSELKNIDYILLSHDHRDHADEWSMKLLAKQNPDAQYLTGLKTGDLLKSWTKSSNIQTAGWYQQFNVNEAFEINYLPSRHWGRRLLFDTNEKLWGGFLFKFKGIILLFCGDSGYGDHFKEISETFPDIDYAIMGIGAYKPEWFMHESHTSPQKAVDGFHDLKAKTLIPMHYGTFDLSDEAVGDPYRTINNINAQQKINGKLLHLKIGEAFEFNI